MLYTIVPIEVIFKTDDVKQHYQEMTVNGISCYVEQMNVFEYKLIRVITSDPNIYLQNKYQPGAIINLKDNL